MNAKDEFLEHLSKRKLILKSSIIKIINCYEPTNNVIFILNENYTFNDYDNFLSCLNFNYDDGFDSQKLDGCILYDDGTWSDRDEYDGSEWWDYKYCPTIESFIKD